MERGLTRVRATDGSYPYEAFQLLTVADVFLTLTQLIDGTETPLDLSASSRKAYLRAWIDGSGVLPINVEMTKRTGTTLPGDTGKVSAQVRPAPANFTAGGFCLMAVYIVDTSVQDTPTVSGFAETLWGQRWEWQVVAKVLG